eukprot:14686314-Alexandrium_andersonii.AAC.1
MHLAIQQDEERPRREQLRNKTQHSERKRRNMNDKFTRDYAEDEMFRRYCGLMGRDPRQPKGEQSKAGTVAPWNWRNFDD